MTVNESVYACLTSTRTTVEDVIAEYEKHLFMLVLALVVRLESFARLEHNFFSVTKRISLAACEATFQRVGGLFDWSLSSGAGENKIWATTFHGMILFCFCSMTWQTSLL